MDSGNFKNLSFPIILLVLFSLSSLLGFSQGEIDINPYIKAWKTTDTSQTIQFERSLRLFNKDLLNDYKEITESHPKILSAAKEYLKKHPDDRLAIRILLYEISSNFISKTSMDKSFHKKVLDQIPAVVHKLDDKQLLTELYVAYAYLKRPESEYIFYMSKALRNQEEIGSEHFPKYCSLLFELLTALYHNNNFQESIEFAKKNLECRENPSKFIDPFGYIYVLDLLGASYLKLKDYDNAELHYLELLKVLENHKQATKEFKSIWTGIAKSNLGIILFEQNKVEESIPFLKDALDITIENQIWNTASSTLNVLATIDYDNGKYNDALKKWSNALEYADKSEIITRELILQLKYTISENLAKTYKIIGNIDSTYHYLHVAKQNHLLYQELINERNFELININLDFEEAQNKLVVSQEKLKSEKTLRNGILIGIAILGFVSIFILYQRRLQNHYKHKVLIQQKEFADLQIEEARKNIQFFKKNLAEKEALIETLQNQSKLEETDDQDLNQKLSEYVLVTDDEWLNFKEDFSKAYPQFLKELRKVIDNPTAAEERLSCLIACNLNNSQISAMLGIGTDSVARSKRRLKKRIQLPDNVLLEEYIKSLSVE